jgi:hypothetical protein
MTVTGCVHNYLTTITNNYNESIIKFILLIICYLYAANESIYLDNNKGK